MDPFGDSDSHHKGLGMGKEGVIHRIKAPHKDVHILIPRTYECVTVQGKRDLAGVIKLRILNWGRLFWIIWIAPK